MSLDKLLEISSDALGPRLSARVPRVRAASEDRRLELEMLLGERNGFWAFESALHVFPVGQGSVSYDLIEWNDDALWRHEYRDLGTDLMFFAEDIFGNPFAFDGSRVVQFIPETGQTEPLADSLEQWASMVLDDYRVLTGHPLAHEWQSRNGLLQSRQRLIPKIPFVCGGAYEIENLYAGDCAAAMKFRGYLANQIRDLPDGTPIKFTIVK